MRFNIPTLGDRLVVSEPWAIELHREHRNYAAFTWLNSIDPTVSTEDTYFDQVEQVTIPAGTVLSVDRIYIRKGASDFDSITFNVIGVKGLGRVRFWVKLSQVSNLEYSPVP